MRLGFIINLDQCPSYIVVRLNMVQSLHPLWLNWWKVSSPYTARNGSVTYFGAISKYMYS